MQWDCVEGRTLDRNVCLWYLDKKTLSPDCDCERMLILGQLGMFSCNLWISQDFGAILLIPWQSFAVSQSLHNSIGLSRLLPRCFGRSPEAIALHLHSILNPRGCARLARSQRTKSTTIPRIAKDCASIARVLG